MVRLKARYILFDILTVPQEPLTRCTEKELLLTIHSTTSPSLTQRQIAELIRKQVLKLFGDFGNGVLSSSMVVKYFSSKTSTGIIRCSRDYYQMVCCALTTITNVLGKDVIIRVLSVSGTIKKCEQAAIERNRQLMRKLNTKIEEDGILDIDEDDEETD